MDLPASLGDFKPVAVLGEGGSGVVYDAVWGPRRVALKVLHAHLVVSAREREQFLDEARLLAAVAHPGVVKVFAVGELADRRPYLAMERLEGETLAHMLGRGPLPLADALALFGELCAAVSALHAQGLIHRDLKPENVFVVGGEHVVLLDFGIAKQVDAGPSTATRDGGVRGSPAYMAPERFFGQPAGLATDVYELAVTFYAMIAGRLPWDELADAEARLSPRPLAIDGVPAELDVELRRALSTRASNRPASAAALEAALRVAAGGARASAGDGDGGGASEAAPRAADTAPMRSRDVASIDAAAAPSTRATVEGHRGGSPWFSERAATTDRGRTPLAWAPSEPASPPRRRRWPVAAAGGAAVAIIAAYGGVAGWFARGDATTVARAANVAPPPVAAAPADASAGVHATTTATTTTTTATTPAANDPWAAVPPPAVGSGSAGAGSSAKFPPAPRPAHSSPADRAAMRAAAAHLPADSRAVAFAELDDIAGDAAIGPALAHARTDSRVAMVFDMVPACAQTLLRDSAWVAVGAQSFTGQTATVIVGGRWHIDDVTRCLPRDDSHHGAARADAGAVWTLASSLRLIRLDDHTALLTNRDDVDPFALAAQTGAPPSAVRAALAKLPADRAIVVVDSATSGDDFASTFGTPADTSFAGAVALDGKSVAYDATAELADAARAAAAEPAVRDHLAPIAVVSGMQLVRAGRTLHVSGRIEDSTIEALVGGSPP